MQHRALILWLGAASLLPLAASPGAAAAPLPASPAWSAESNQPFADFGISVATAGDVNGDGFSDLLVGSRYYDNGEPNEGRVFLFLGSAGGLGAAPAWTIESDQAGAELGYAVAAAGDVNGDGFDDVVAGAYRHHGAEVDEGWAALYLGSASGLDAAPAWTAEGGQPGARLGISVAGAGDVNGDGFADVLVGADQYDNGEEDEGRATLYVGSAAGLGATPAWTAEGDQPGAHLGIRVAAAGDVNGDGFADVVIGAAFHDGGAPDDGRVLVYLGSAAGLGAAPDWFADGGQAGAALGWAAGTAGDVNGDGFADVIAGARGYDGGEIDEGRALLFLGSAAGLGAAPAWIAGSDQAGAEFGYPVVTAGDVNGDGFADVIVGAWRFDNGETDEGQASVFLGSAAGLGAAAAWTAEGDQTRAEFALALGTAGDVNGDGFSDVVIGAPAYDHVEPGEGRVLVFHGAAAGLAAAPAWTAESNQSYAELGMAVAAAGDVNGDGFSDVVIGAPGYDAGQIDEGRAALYLGSPAGLAGAPAWTAEGDQAGAAFGAAVAGAGDVNGDGFADVIVGAERYASGQAAEGRAFLFLGSPAGLGAAPAWTAESNQALAWFGHAVAGAGDVNGDGFADVIVGAYAYDGGIEDEGRAYVFLGSATGLGTAPAWIAGGGQVAARFGIAVAAAGDVNGDGFSDVIIGADLHDGGAADAGRAYVYLGSASGLAPDPAWIAEGDQAGGALGRSVAAAGDVNGDGFADVIVGAWKHDGGEIDEGQALVYHGSPSGLAATAAWTAEGDLDGSQLGSSVATAGDVNGDGFADVVAGAIYAAPGGRAQVHHGGPAGLDRFPDWAVVSAEPAARLGAAVAAAGDVNGDGFADLITGAPGHDGGQSDEGLALVFGGNAGGGLHRIPRMTRADGSAPIGLLGVSDSETSFRLRALGRTPAGRGLVRLEWEVEPDGVPFDGQGLATGVVRDSGVPTGGSGSTVPLDELAAGLAPGTLYHWRLRILSGSPFFPRSRWLWLPGNSVTEADVRTAQSGASVAGESATPAAAGVRLEPGFPNPFRLRTELRYDLRRAGRVRIEVIDAGGRRVVVLADAMASAGRHVARWDGRDASGRRLPGGTYFVRLTVEGATDRRKITLVR